MGIVISRCYTKHLIELSELRARISLLESENQHREAALSTETRKQKEVVAGLRRRVEEEAEKVMRLKAEAIGGCRCHGWQLHKDYFEYMQEQERREEATGKWKQLYLAIKIELDDLIRRTREGDRYCGAKGLAAQGLLRELKAKDEALEAFRSKLAAMKKEGARREREIDILRQSLRILTSSMGTRGRRSMKKKTFTYNC